MLHLLAHEKWFIDPHEFPLRFDLMFKPLPLAFIGGTVIATVALAIIFRLRRHEEILPGPLDLGSDRERLCGFYGLVPLVIALHLAVSLLVAGTQRNLFTVNNHLDTAPGYLIGLVEVGCALSFFYGGLTRLAAISLAFIWLAGIFVLGPQTMLDNVHMLGFAGFFFLAGRGPIAIDRLLFPTLEPHPNLMRHAIPTLRFCLGLGLAIVAFTEKFANLPMALAFLEKYPVNFTAHFGMPLPDHVFILCGGAVELLVGLCVMFNIFTRTILVIAWIPFNLTLAYFNWNSTEFIGHLPIYGAMAVLMVWDPAGSHTPLFIRGLRAGPLRILNDPHCDAN